MRGLISIQANMIALVVLALACFNKMSHSTPLHGSASMSGNLMVSTFCRFCDYKEACSQSLAAFATNPSANPKDLIQASIQASIQPITLTMQKTASLAASFSANSRQKIAMEDCQELLQYATEELQSSSSVVGACELKGIPERQADLMNWLSAVISYQETCLDGIPDMNLKNQISTGLINSNQLVSNSLAIMFSMASIFGALKIPFPTLGHGFGFGNSGSAGFASGFDATKSFGAGFHHSGSRGSSHENSPNFGHQTPSPVNQHANNGFGVFGNGGGFVRSTSRGGLSGNSGGPIHTNRQLAETPIDSEEKSSAPTDTDPFSDDKPEENGAYPSWFSAADRRMLASTGEATPNAVVAKDGSGQYKTIEAALAAYPKNHKGRYVIYVKAGKYDEYITIPKNQINVYMYGDGPRKTIVTGSKNFRDGVSTFRTATFSAIGSGFVAKSMGFQNTAGPGGHQAVALRVQSDMSAFYNCRMDGHQDTLYVHAHRQFYRNCVISGTVDFIFGDAAAVIQNSLIIVRKPDPNQRNAVTAQGRKDKYQTTGIVIQNCRIVPEQLLYPERLKVLSYLGRPWKEFSRTVIMESIIEDFIQPAGWLEWEGNFALDTLTYREYANQGPGAATNNRVKWKGYKVITDKKEAMQFTPGAFLQANMWLKNTGGPFFLGFKN